MATKSVYLGIDVGTKRIGLAVADSVSKIAQPLATISTDQDGLNSLQDYIKDLDVTHLIVGRPRNQDGDLTAQTLNTEEFASRFLTIYNLPIVWQDESLTSVMAEQRLESRKKPYTKKDIDAEAATIILQDYLEELRYGAK